ncbi:MAG: MucR family transcriptional regulator [Alphaproteobacteria bacterium]
MDKQEKIVNQLDLMAFTTEVVAAHLAHNNVPMQDVPAFIHQVYQSFAGLGQQEAIAKLPEKLQPAVAVKKSIFPDYIICLEDGKKLKMLKRHLKTAYNMTPEEYREKWNLPPDYPMVAPNYAEQRSKLAKEIGLGVRGRDDEDEQG